MQTRERIVLKYGGTSVGTGNRLCHVSSIIKQITTETLQQPILVVSAMSGTLKSQGTTQLLLEAVEEILKPNSQKYFEIVNGIESNHLKACREAIMNNPAQLEALETQVRSECTRLRSFMSAAEVFFTNRS